MSNGTFEEFELPLSFHTDEKGYIDRQCPSDGCQYIFKISADDWPDKVSNEGMHCPMCGYISSPENWCTSEQEEQIVNNALNFIADHVEQSLEKAFGEVARKTKNNKFVSIHYIPGKRISFANNPIGQMDAWENEILCEKCGTHYSVIGAAFFCPCCGYNSAIMSFNAALDRIGKMLESITDMKMTMTEKYSIDDAETMCRAMIEYSICEIVSAFQKYACSIFEKVTGRSSRVNNFQRIDTGSNLFGESCGKKYSDYLSDSELTYLRIMFQKRHLIEHNNGMVDQQYIDLSQDAKYSVGQRIVVGVNDAQEMLSCIQKLGKGLASIIL